MGFIHLPLEIKLEIASHRSFYKDVVSLAQVNRQLNEIFRNQAKKCIHNNSQDPAGLTPLIKASMSGDREEVSTLLHEWAEVDLPDSLGRTPLSWASGSGHKDVVQKLLQLGARVNKFDGFGRTALSWAAEKGHFDVVELLVHHGAKVSILHLPNIEKLENAVRKPHPNSLGLRGIFSRKLREPKRSRVLIHNVLRHELGCIDPLSLAMKNEHGKTIDFLQSKSADYSYHNIVPSGE